MEQEIQALQEQLKDARKRYRSLSLYPSLFLSLSKKRKKSNLMLLFPFLSPFFLFFFLLSPCRDHRTKDIQTMHKEKITKKDSTIHDLEIKIEETQKENKALLQKIKKVIPLTFHLSIRLLPPLASLALSPLTFLRLAPSSSSLPLLFPLSSSSLPLLFLLSSSSLPLFLFSSSSLPLPFLPSSSLTHI